MRLKPESQRRYARQLTLPEIGESGQVRLACLSPQPPVDADPLALEWATRYLERAGVGDEAGPDSLPLAIPDHHEVMRSASSIESYPVMALLTGAFAAVEALKAALEVGRPGTLSEWLASGGEG